MHSTRETKYRMHIAHATGTVCVYTRIKHERCRAGGERGGICYRFRVVDTYSIRFEHKQQYES